MLVDNLSSIKLHITFESGTFYHLQILQRKKEHPELGSNSYCLKTYYIDSEEKLDRYWPEIKILVEQFKARAYINLNKRSFETLALHHLKKCIDQMSNKDCMNAYKAYSSVAGSFTCEKEKKWIIDIDSKDDQERMFSSACMMKCDPKGPKVLFTIPTKNGYHQIVKPFNVIQYKALYSEEKGLPKTSYVCPDIHKDNPTLLYG